MKHLLLSLFLSIGLFTVAQAQSSLDDQGMLPVLNSPSDLTECVYLDAEEKICFVDLEKVPMNLKQAVLINASGDEVINKKLQEMPVNSIVELDYSNLPSGSYILELRSYRGATHKALRL